MKAFRFLAVLLFSVPLLSLVPVPSAAQEGQWQPQRPVRVIVPYAAGGGADIIMRRVAERAGKLLGQPMIIENRPGAATGIGASAVANAQADGYTLLFATSTTLSINPYVKRQLPYAVEQFTPVASVQSLPFMLDVTPSLPVTSLSELVSHAKANPGKLNLGTLGIGSSNHVLGSLLTRAAGVELVPVHFTSGAPAMLSLLRGDIHVYFDGIPTSIARAASGEIRGIAVTSEERVPAAPAVPTVHEQGFPELGLSIWYGLVAPAGTPAAAVERLNRLVNEVLADPEIAESISKDGAFPLRRSPAEFGELIKADSQRWKQALDSLNLELE